MVVFVPFNAVNGCSLLISLTDHVRDQMTILHLKQVCGVRHNDQQALIELLLYLLVS